MRAKTLNTFPPLNFGCLPSKFRKNLLSPSSSYCFPLNLYPRFHLTICQDPAQFSAHILYRWIRNQKPSNHKIFHDYTLNHVPPLARRSTVNLGHLNLSSRIRKIRPYHYANREIPINREENWIFLIIRHQSPSLLRRQTTIAPPLL